MKKIVFLVVVGALCLSSCSEDKKESWEPIILKDFKKDKNASILPDFSYAGYGYGEQEISTDLKVYEITDFGAAPNDSKDDTKAINEAIEHIGKSGGGILNFPKGKFLVNSNPSNTEIVQINYSNVVLRGSGTNENGTIMYAGSSSHQAENDSPWLSPFIIHTGLNLQDTHSFYGAHKIEAAQQVTKPIKKGNDLIEVSSTQGLSEGSFVYLSLKNTEVAPNLLSELMHPLEFETFQKTYTDAGKTGEISYQYLFEVAEVLNETTLKLKQPVRRNYDLKYKPELRIVPMLTGIGVENMRFESAWSGDYTHHGNREMDYGWGAICLQRVAHGFIRNVSINNFTQTTHLVNSRNNTIENVVINGDNGHYGPKTYHACDNLIQNIEVNNEVTHGPSVEGISFGNVFRNIKYKHPTPIDLHGTAGKEFCPPMYNLFENIQNVSRIAGGAAPQNTPHAGEYNTFWNLSFKGWEDQGYTELFYSWIWRDTVKFSKTMHIDCHKQYLRSIMVGAKPSDSTKLLTIEHIAEDRANEWIYVEDLNSNQDYGSLYKTQLELRIN